MSGLKRKGFTFLELIVVIAILALVATISVPPLRRLLPGYEQRAFISNLNTLLATARDNALLTQKIHRVVFNIAEHTVIMEQQTEKKGPDDQYIFEPVVYPYGATSINWPADLFEIKNFYIDSRDEMRLTVGQAAKQKVWFFVIPEGLAQQVTMNLINLPREKELSLVLNPFSVQMSEYEKFMQPA